MLISVALSMILCSSWLVDDVTTVAVPGGGRPVVAKVDKEGTIHLLFDSDDGPKYTKSCDNGVTFITPIRVLGDQSKAPGLEYSAWDLAVGKGGRIHVAMGTNAWKLKLPVAEWGFFYSSLDPSKNTFSPVRNINHKPSEGFSLAADYKGNLTACWLSGKLYANVSHDDGKTFEPSVEINPKYNPCDCCTTSVAYGDDGKLAVFYREETDNERDMFLVLWDQTSGHMTRNRVGQTPWKVEACPMTYFTVSRERGGFLTTWPTKGQIYFARLDAEGKPTTASEIKTPGKSGMRTGIIALNDPDGNTLVAWKKDGRIGWQQYDSQGRAVGSAGSVESAGSGVAGVVSNDGRFLLFR